MKTAKLPSFYQLDSVKIVIIISLQCQDWRKTDEKGREKAGGDSNFNGFAVSSPVWNMGPVKSRNDP